jgi:pimeloyl-ACP methyl ester carboxylesterase
MMTRCGYEPVSGTYYETLGAGSAGRPPWLMLHGGSGTGAVFRLTADGRPGWADSLASRGDHQVWLVDYPGVGRSVSVDALGVDYDAAVDGVVRLLRDVIGRPVILLGHSIGGSVAWKVAELARPYVHGVLGIAAASPGNLQPEAEVVSDDGRNVTVMHESGLEITVGIDRMFVTPKEFVIGQWVTPTSRLDPEHVPAFLKAVGPTPPRMVLQRLGALGGIPPITDTGSFAGLWIRLVVAPNDPLHTREHTEPMAALFREWGADVEIVDLAGLGIDGNGHFMLSESNSDDVLAVIEREVARRPQLVA